MYDMIAQGVDERMINVHCNYYYKQSLFVSVLFYLLASVA